MEVQGHYKKRFTKKSCRKVFIKTIDKKSKTVLFYRFVLSRFWAFFDEGSLKNTQKNREKN
jgi:hypothetical protein